MANKSFLLTTFTFILCLNNSQSLFDQCNHVITLKPGEKIYVNSPYYPGSYPVGSSCRYMVKAPLDYQLELKCTIKLNAVRERNMIIYFFSMELNLAKIAFLK